jgi:AAA ATPase domain
MGEVGHPGRPGGGRAFVGRDRELAELMAALEDAVGGRGRLLLVAGEPGIGKTWLAEHLAEHAVGHGVGVLWGRCWEGGGAPPFWPWAQIITTLAEGCNDETLAAYLGAGAASITQVVPGLTQRLGTTAVARVAAPESEAARFYLFAAITDLFKAASSAQPLLLVLDDLHAADDPSMLLLKFLARGLRGAHLLVVGIYRDVEAAQRPGMGDAVGDLVREGQLVNLRGLDREDVKAVIERLSAVAPSEATVAAIHQATEGNPLFVREAVRLLGSQATVKHPGWAGPIPGSVRAVIQRRLAPLSADAIQVLSAAAVVGREFDLSLLGPAGELPAERVLGSLSEAVALGVVTEEPSAADRYRFSHSLMREVVYDRLPIPVRMQLHRRVGEAIERLYGTGPGAHVAELARHFGEVAAIGEAAKALAYARLAGERAMGMCAYEEAAAQYQRALHALKVAGFDEPVRCGLLLRLGEARARAGAYHHARETYRQAAEVSRRLGSPERLARAALGYGEPQVEGGLVDRRLVGLLREALDGLSPEDGPLRVRLLARLSLELTFSDEPQLAEPLSRQAVEMARRLDDVGCLVSALHARWVALAAPDRREEGRALAGEVLQLAQTTGDRELELFGRVLRAGSSLEGGDIRTVETDVAAHAGLAGELRMPVHQWASTTMRAMRALLRGEFEEAERLAGQARSIQPRRPNVEHAHLRQLSLLRWQQGRLAELRERWQAVEERFAGTANPLTAPGWLALADAELGDSEAARRLLEPLVDQIVRLPREQLSASSLAVPCLVASYLDDREAARRLYPVLLPYQEHVIATTIPNPIVCYGSGSLYLGLLAATTSRWAEACDHFETAIGAHERLGARPLLAQTQYEYARMLLRRDRAADHSRALALLEQALATAGPVGMAALVEGVQALQATQESRAVPVGPPTEAATPKLSRNLFRREGEYWTVAYDGAVVRLKDAKGLRHLARLLANPAREFHATDLETADAGGAPPGRGQRAHGRGLESRPDLGDAGELLDAQAKAAYKARLDELRAELDEAEGFNDAARAARARQEMDFLVGELARAVGLGGRDRRAASHAERARLNATRAIRAAMANLARANPALGLHLSATIRTGRYCSYTPDPRVPITWER